MYIYNVYMQGIIYVYTRYTVYDAYIQRSQLNVFVDEKSLS